MRLAPRVPGIWPDRLGARRERRDLAAALGALTYLLDEGDAIVSTRLTDERGRALFGRLRAGRYRVRVEMLGMATQTSELFDARSGETVRHEIGLGMRPIPLEGLDVVVGERCRIRPEEGLLVAQVWDEAGKALRAVELTDRQSAYRYEMLLYDRDFDPDTWEIRREEQSRRRGRMVMPFGSKPAEDLVENGFVQSSEDETLYFAPDAGVLLSDVFLDSHCFRLERGSENEESFGLIGLGFEPTGSESSTVDVAGTLWLDPETSELRWLEFGYENLDPEISSDSIGGRVDFLRTPRGTWIIPEWWIRVPQVAMTVDFDIGRVWRVIAGFRQSGGRVVDIEDNAGRPIAWASPATIEDDAGTSIVWASPATIEGFVRNSLQGSPLRGVRVEVEGTEQRAITDAEGHFSINGLPEGLHQLRFVDAELEAMGFTLEPITLEARRGEVTSVEFRVPSLGELLLDVCRDDPPPESEREGTGVLAGWVRDRVTREPLPGATVRVGWNTAELGPVIDWMGVMTTMSGFEATADERGFYRICGVPKGRLLAVVGAFDGIAAVTL